MFPILRATTAQEQASLHAVASVTLMGACCGAQDNNYIQKGYRKEMTLAESMRSMFQLHNETANIYSHLAGALHQRQPDADPRWEP
jgi:hypothetical protein